MQRKQASDLPQRRGERVRGEQDWSWWDELGWDLRLRKAEAGKESRIVWVQTSALRGRVQRWGAGHMENETYTQTKKFGESGRVR